MACIAHVELNYQPEATTKAGINQRVTIQKPEAPSRMIGKVSWRMRNFPGVRCKPPTALSQNERRMLGKRLTWLSVLQKKEDKESLRNNPHRRVPE